MSGLVRFRSRQLRTDLDCLTLRRHPPCRKDSWGFPALADRGAGYHAV